MKHHLTNTDEKVSFALLFYFPLASKNHTQWHWTIISHCHQMLAWDAAFTEIHTIVQTNLKEVGYSQSDATSPDTFVISEIQSLSLKRATCDELSQEEKQGAQKGSTFTSANSLIDKLSVLHLDYNFCKMPEVKKEKEKEQSHRWPFLAQRNVTLSEDA